MELYMHNPKEILKVRDFIYLDVEKLKSILAQIMEGLPEVQANTFIEGDTSKGGVGASFIKIINAEIQNELFWQNQATESKTLHDNIYNYVEAHLTGNKLIKTIPEQFTSNDAECGKQYDIFRETTFILVRGYSQINDFAYMMDYVDNFEEIAKALAKIHFQGQVFKSNALKNAAIDEYIRKIVGDKELFKEIGKLIKIFYQDRVSFRMVPFPEISKFSFAGPIKRGCLRESIHDIIYKYGTSPTHEWHMFAQIASIPDDKRENKIGSTFGSDIERSVNGVFDALRDLESFFMVTYPEIAVTPIAIYR